MKRYFINTNTPKKTKVYMWSTAINIDEEKEKYAKWGLVEVGWLDFWLYRIFGWKPTTGGDK